MLDQNMIDCLDRIWARYGGDDRWTFVSHFLKNGDMYMVMSVLPAFKATHAPTTPMQLLSVHPRPPKFPTLFPGVFEEMHTVPELGGVGPKEMQYWCMLRGVDKLAAGGFIYLHPFLFT